MLDLSFRIRAKVLFIDFRFKATFSKQNSFILLFYWKRFINGPWDFSLNSRSYWKYSLKWRSSRLDSSSLSALNRAREGCRIKLPDFIQNIFFKWAKMVPDSQVWKPCSFVSRGDVFIWKQADSLRKPIVKLPLGDHS